MPRFRPRYKASFRRMTIMSDNLAHYLMAFRTLNVNRASGRASPHKPCMLLAMLGLAEAGVLGKTKSASTPRCRAVCELL
jgi:putative restriction endonuclease